MKIAFLAWEHCDLADVTEVLRTLCSVGVVRTLTSRGQPVRTDCGLMLQADAAVEAALPTSYQWVVLPAGPVPADVLDDPHCHRFLRQFNTQPKAMFIALGYSPRLLAAAGLLGGLRWTGVPPKDEADRARFAHTEYMDTPISVDGNVLTAKVGCGKDLAHVVARRLATSSEDTRRP
ncbi:DJ-1/PfpI family protein [Alicyclobacillus contaminans]|uniref:DJ-1/PfpI family protein n=1 Tax=Alicyclobacillus contaminans TaxID=392016 RepID=UPI00041599F4|nr:DJ-1/PfpI family protein [Alicyclobacillus contaminans]